jgi:hypothetical protein
MDMKGPVFRIILAVALTVAAVAATPPADSANRSIQSSETLTPAGEIEYGAANLTDRDIRTAWCVEGGSASPAWISLRFDKPTPLPVLGWFGGYQKNDRVFRTNARPRTIAAYADGRLLGRFVLDDQTGLQRLELPGGQANEYKFVIEAAYPGTKYDDLCVTEVLRDSRSVDGFLLANLLARNAESRALSDAEIETQYREISDFWRSFFDDKWAPVGPEYDRPFWNAVALRTSAWDEGSLRFLLNLRHHVQRRQIASAELSEGLRDLVIPYFENDAAVVADVWADRYQAGGDTIESALYMFVDSWRPEQINERRSKDPGFDRLVRMACVSHAKKARYCDTD